MDLSLIQNRLKQGYYNYASEVRRDLDLIISNCMQYNFKNEDIKKIAEKFNNCINTEWKNFENEIATEEMEARGINIYTRLNI